MGSSIIIVVVVVVIIVIVVIVVVVVMTKPVLFRLLVLFTFELPHIEVVAYTTYWI
jgi:bacteriorhodopsin